MNQAREALHTAYRLTRRALAVLAAVSWLLMATAPSAHQSTAMYDSQNPVTITGTVIKFEWTHAFSYLEVKDERTRKVVEREVEMMSLNHLHYDIAASQDAE